MKVNAEKFLDNLDQYKFEKTVFFVSGNENGLINKVNNIILSKYKSNIYSETRILDFKTDNASMWIYMIENIDILHLCVKNNSSL